MRNEQNEIDALRKIIRDLAILASILLVIFIIVRLGCG